MKYAVLLLALMFAGCEERGTTEKESSEIGGHYTVGYEVVVGTTTVQVAKEDFPKSLSWDDAMAACQNLGNGWRLPSKEELEEMYSQLHKQGKGNFQKDFYWSSSLDNSGNAWVVNFDDGYVDIGDGGYGKNGSYQVRAVRALP